MKDMAFICTADDMHPYNCYGPDGTGDGTEKGNPCVHCRREKLEGHDPDQCALCHFTDQTWLKEHGVL